MQQIAVAKSENVAQRNNEKTSHPNALNAHKPNHHYHEDRQEKVELFLNAQRPAFDEVVIVRKYLREGHEPEQRRSFGSAVSRHHKVVSKQSEIVQWPCPQHSSEPKLPNMELSRRRQF